MSEVEIHPAAALFPMLDEFELHDLAKSIERDGLHNPIIVDTEGRIIDGRNRLVACELADVEPTFETFDGDDVVGFVLAQNLYRRHLSQGQKAVALARVHAPDGRWGQGKRAAVEQSLLNPIGTRSLTAAAFVVGSAPDLADRVMAGTLSLEYAEQEARLRSPLLDIEKAREREREMASRRAVDLPMRVIEIDAKLAGAQRHLSDAIKVRIDVELPDEAIEILQDSLTKIRARLDLLDLRFGGSTDVDWDEELRGLEGGN